MESDKQVAVRDQFTVREQVQVTTKVHMWWVWTRIAVRHVGQARDARTGDVTPASYEDHSSAALSREYEAAVVAIAAVAFATEALDKELEASGHVLDKSKFTAPKPTNRGYYVAQRIAQAFTLDPATAARFEERLVDLFDLRNDSVHFESEWREGSHPHPKGTKTAYEFTIYTLERAEEAVRLGRAIIAEGAAAATAGRLVPNAEDLARELPGVLSMLDEVMKGAGF
ncbi:MAG: hypothetical protein M3O70_26345 [Actinomycetota bacterium]|nr:hypothetical protein [Actinomycetota bacterium]